MTRSCCFRECAEEGAPELRLAITPRSAGEPIIVWAHESCFEGSRHTADEPDGVRNHDRVPSKSRCAFCGDALPLFGNDPYVFDVGTAYPPQRHSAHVDCLHERVDPGIVEQLKIAPPLKY